MEKRIENHITMFKTVLTQCQLNIALITPNAGLNNAFDKYASLMNEIEPVSKAQILDRTGVAMNKKDLREQLALAAEEASGIIMSHFDSVNDHIIYTSVDVSLTKLRGMRDMKFIAHVENIIDILTTRQADLVSFNVDANYISDISKLLEAYKELVSTPTIASNIRKTATAELSAKVKTINDFLLKELDKAMLVLKKPQSNFYSTYSNARRIINSGVRHTTTGTIMGIVKDEATGEIISGATAEIVNTQTVVLSDELGQFNIIDVPAASYAIKVSAGDYQSKTLENIIVPLKGAVQVEVKLTAAA